MSKDSVSKDSMSKDSMSKDSMSKCLYVERLYVERLYVEGLYVERLYSKDSMLKINFRTLCRKLNTHYTLFTHTTHTFYTHVSHILLHTLFLFWVSFLLKFFFFSLNACFTSDHQTLGVYSRSRYFIGALIMSYKLIKVFRLSHESNQAGVICFNYSTKRLTYVKIFFSKFIHHT